MSFETLSELFKKLKEESLNYLPEGFIEVHENLESAEITLSIGDSSYTFNKDLECSDTGTMLGMFKKWSVIRLEDQEPLDLSEEEQEEFITRADTNVDPFQEKQWWQKGEPSPDWKREDEHDDEEFV